MAFSSRSLAAALARLRGAWLPSAAPQQEQQRVVRLQEELLTYLQRVKTAFKQHSCSEGRRSRISGMTAQSAGSALSFQLQLGRSSIPGAGRGVFLVAGSCPQGSIVTLYPGLVYNMADFLTQLATSAPDEAFAPTPPAWVLNNRYLLQLRCPSNSVLVDGQPHGLSAQRFLAAAAASGAPTANTSWLPDDWADEQAGLAPVLAQSALGNMVNHSARAATVGFELCPLPDSLPDSLLRFVPALNAQRAPVRWVPLLIARNTLCADSESDSHEPIELLVNYGTNPCSLGYHSCV